MTQMAPEPAPAAPAPARARRENVFTRKIGPMPMWVWLTIGLVLVLGYAYWKNRQNAQAQAQQQTAQASQVPQLVNQVYTTVTPPTAPTPPPGGGQVKPPVKGDKESALQQAYEDYVKSKTHKNWEFGQPVPKGVESFAVWSRKHRRKPLPPTFTPPSSLPGPVGPPVRG